MPQTTRKKPDRKSKPISTKERVRSFRNAMEKGGWKRKEIWVPRDMTREEGQVLQDWIEEILTDIRRAPPVQVDGA